MVKKNKISKIILSRANHLNDLVERLPGHFEEADLHEIRIHIKKLKALLRLLQSSHTQTSEIKLPSSIRQLYNSIGSIRNLQLFLHQTEQATAKLGFCPTAYIYFLQHELEEEKMKSAENLPAPELIFREAKAVEQDVDSRLCKSDIREFMKRKSRKIKHILQSKVYYPELHLVRKQIKDIQYNIRFGKKLITAADRRALKRIGDLLGHYCDACLAWNHYEAFVGETGCRQDAESKAMRWLLSSERFKFQHQAQAALADLHFHTK